MPDNAARAYYHHRASAARASAERATDPVAVRVHMRLAEEYEKVASGEENLRRLIEGTQPYHVDPDDEGHSSSS